MMWPQLCYLALIFIGIGTSLSNHGKSKTGTESVWISLITASLIWWLLYEGGFWRPLGFAP